MVYYIFIRVGFFFLSSIFNRTIFLFLHRMCVSDTRFLFWCIVTQILCQGYFFVPLLCLQLAIFCSVKLVDRSYCMYQHEYEWALTGNKPAGVKTRAKKNMIWLGTQMQYIPHDFDYTLRATHLLNNTCKLDIATTEKLEAQMRLDGIFERERKRREKTRCALNKFTFNAIDTGNL